LLRVLWHIWSTPDVGRILALVGEATEATRRLGDRRAEALTRLWEAQVLEHNARPRAALAALDDAVRLARDAGSASLLVDARALRVEPLMQMGRWQELEETVDEALPELMRLGSTYFGYELIAVHAWSRLLRGMSWTPPHGLEVRFHESLSFVSSYRANAAREAAERGRTDERGAKMLDWLAATVPVAGSGLAWATAGVPVLGAMTLAGRRDDVAARYEGVAAFPRLMLYASFAPLDLARAAVLLKRWDDAESHFDNATRIATEEGLEVALARTLVERGNMYRLRGRRGDRARAAAVLERAVAICTHLGLEPDAARARALLEQVGPVTVSSLPAGLTPREAEVLRLLAGGRTNRQIADGLTISEKTVEQHLLNIYQKLQVDSRARAVAFAYDHHLV
jgi:DNA-binding CsgD family transcriptional regulator